MPGPRRRAFGSRQASLRIDAMMSIKMVAARMVIGGLTVLAALLLVVAPIAAKAQATGKVWRIGYLTPSEIPMETLIAALRELGYVEGRTARLEVRSAQND